MCGSRGIDDIEKRRHKNEEINNPLWKCCVKGFLRLFLFLNIFVFYEVGVNVTYLFGDVNDMERRKPMM